MTAEARDTLTKTARPWIVYSLMILAVIGAYDWIRSFGDHLVAAPPRSAEVFGSAPSMDRSTSSCTCCSLSCW
jgi:hypothetical protein